MIYNERLTNDTKEISRMLFDCEDYTLKSDFTVANTMNASVTEYVDHFSATNIEMYAAFHEYYPGLSMEFYYWVTDRLGTVIGDAAAENTMIILTSGSFVSMLYIDQNGECQNCDEGIMLSELSIADNIGDNYTLTLVADNDRLILGLKEVTFNVTGCPIGYGADSNNNTCTVCDTATYNIEENFVRNCLSCEVGDDDPGDNDR